MATTSSSKSERYKKHLDVLNDQLTLVYKAIEELLSGKIVKYQIGSRNVEHHDWSLDELYDFESTLMSEIEKYENLIDSGSKRRHVYGAVFNNNW